MNILRRLFQKPKASPMPPRDLREKPGTIPGYRVDDDPTYANGRQNDPRFSGAAEILMRSLCGK